MWSGAKWLDVITGKSNINGPPDQGLTAGEGYVMLAARKDHAGPFVPTTGAYSPLKLTKSGELWIGGSSVYVLSSNAVGVTVAGLTTLILAPQTNTYIRVHALQACNQANNIVAVSWTETGGILKWLKALGQNGEFLRVFTPNWWDLPDGTALQLNCDVAPVGKGVQWTVEYEVLRVHE